MCLNILLKLLRKVRSTSIDKIKKVFIYHYTSFIRALVRVSKVAGLRPTYVLRLGGNPRGEIGALICALAPEEVLSKR